MTNQNTINVAYIFESKAFSQCTFFTGTSDILNSTHDEHKLLKLLVDIDTNWHELGQALKITYNDLEGLEAAFVQPFEVAICKEELPSFKMK